MLLLWLGLMLVSGTAATVSPAVLAEISARGHAPVLVEIAQKDGTDVLNDFRAERKGTCNILQSWALIRVMHIDATADCLEGLRKSASVNAVDLVGAGFLVAADSLAIPRYQRAAILGGGLADEPAELREVFRQEACFCINGRAGCCPGGVTQQVGELAAAGGLAGRTTETLAFGLARPGHSNIIDGANLSLLALRIAAPQAESVSMASVLDALHWLVVGKHEIGMVVLSFESDEVYCGPCEGRSVANRSMAAYIKRLRARGIRILAPDLGFQIRGAPSWLPGVERFPASVDLPGVSTELRSLGTIVGGVASVSTFESKAVLPKLSASIPGKVFQIHFESPRAIAGKKDRSIPSVYSFHGFRNESVFQLVRGAVFDIGLDISSPVFLKSGQVSSCSLYELTTDRANAGH
jgi:hypothetical protein